MAVRFLFCAHMGRHPKETELVYKLDSKLVAVGRSNCPISAEFEEMQPTLNPNRMRTSITLSLFLRQEC